MIQTTTKAWLCTMSQGLHTQRAPTVTPWIAGKPGRGMNLFPLPLRGTDIREVLEVLQRLTAPAGREDDMSGEYSLLGLGSMHLL